jgi:uncharacterized Fe-S cluster-containing radical SAM superfamily protein
MNKGFSIINTEKFSAQLRRRGILLDEKKILMTKFTGSKQETDFTVPANCAGLGRIHHFKRQALPDWIPNPLPTVPAARALCLGDIEGIEAQVFQNAICSWRCWYCFVDFELLAGDPRFSEFKTADELVDLYLSEPVRPKLIDLSGGQPDLVPEWSVWFMEALAKRKLEKTIYVWSDDNLSNDYLWRYLAKEQVARLADSPNYGRVGCFKGFDDHSFSFNTKAAPELFAQQFALMRRLVDAGFDIYGYVTFTTDDATHLRTKMADFVDRLQEDVHPLFPLRTVPLKILPFSPTISRVHQWHESVFRSQIDALRVWSEELQRRFSPDQLAKQITEHDIRGRNL